jgi:hypothetical protein
MKQPQIIIKVTWARNASLFVCRYIKSKWLLRQLGKLTVAKIYRDGELKSKVKLNNYLNEYESYNF